MSVCSPNHVWLTSDSHFQHTNVLGYCNRPFKSSEEMDAEMIRRWNSVVKKNDIVYHLGDFAMGNKTYIESIISQLNGEISIILGNHDEHSARWYMDRGFVWASRHSIIIAEFIILSHAPVFLEWNSPMHNIHGHIHQHKYADEEHYTNVCVEQTDYTPITLQSVFDKIAKIQKEKKSGLSQQETC